MQAELHANRDQQETRVRKKKKRKKNTPGRQERHDELQYTLEV